MPRKTRKAKAKSAPRSARSKEASSGLSPRQWRLPVGVKADGTGTVSLRDLVTGSAKSRPLSRLTAKERAEVTVQRIAKQRKYRIAMVGVGVLDKKRAVAEVRSGSHAGKTLIEIERRMIKRVLAKARSAYRKGETTE